MHASTAYLASGGLNTGKDGRLYFDRFSNGVFDIVGATAEGLGQDPAVQLKAYAVDESAWARGALCLAERVAPTSQTVEDGHATLRVAAVGDGIAMLSVPYDEGWTLTVDGTEREPTVVAGTFIGVDVPQGDHVIELTYLSPGLVPGAVASGAGVLLGTGAVLLERRRKA